MGGLINLINGSLDGRSQRIAVKLLADLCKETNHKLIGVATKVQVFLAFAHALLTADKTDAFYQHQFGMAAMVNWALVTACLHSIEELCQTGSFLNSTAMSVMQQVVDFVVTKIYPKKGT